MPDEVCDILIVPGLFFVGYILTQVPTNMILNKMKPSLFLVIPVPKSLCGESDISNKYQPGVMCSWAIVSACTGAVQNYRGLLALRFVLGFVEAPFFRMTPPRAISLFSRAMLIDVYSRCSLSLFFLVHEARASSPYFHPLRGCSDIRRIRWPPWQCN